MVGKVRLGGGVRSATAGNYLRRRCVYVTLQRGWANNTATWIRCCGCLPSAAAHVSASGGTSVRSGTWEIDQTERDKYKTNFHVHWFIFFHSFLSGMPLSRHIDCSGAALMRVEMPSSIPILSTGMRGARRRLSFIYDLIRQGPINQGGVKQGYITLSSQIHSKTYCEVVIL